MPSQFEAEFAEFATPDLVERFAQREPDTDEFATIEYRSTQDGAPFNWRAILYRVQFQDDVTPQGEIVRIETRTVVIERALMTADGVTKFQKNARVVIDGTEWETREIDTRFGDTLVTLSLQRVVLNELGGRRGSV